MGVRLWESVAGARRRGKLNFREGLRELRHSSLTLLRGGKVNCGITASQKIVNASRNRNCKVSSFTSLRGLPLRQEPPEGYCRKVDIVDIVWDIVWSLWWWLFLLGRK